MKEIGFMVILAIGLLTSCSKDDNTKTENGLNNFTFQNEKHITEYAFYLEGLSGSVVSLNSIDVEDNQIIFHFNNSDYINVSGTYTYKYYEDPTYDPALNFGDITMYIREQLYQDFTQGSLTVSKDGDNINISYNFSGPSGTVNGKYEGQCLQL